MNLVLLKDGELDAGGRVRVEGRRGAHLIGVLGVHVGSRVRVGIEGGAVGEAEVSAVHADGVELRVELVAEPGAPPRIDLVLAMPRPKVLSRVLQAVAGWGVRRIDVVNAWRVEKSYFASPRLEPDALRHDLVLGCEQGGTTWVPDVAVHPLLMPFLSDALGPRLATEQPKHRLIAHPHASAPLEEVVAPGASGQTVLAIGPEGGWIDRELESFRGLGFSAVSVAASVLRVEIAAAVILAQLALLQRIRAESAGLPVGGD